jgi:hypothetical protein
LPVNLFLEAIARDKKGMATKPYLHGDENYPILKFRGENNSQENDPICEAT